MNYSRHLVLLWLFASPLLAQQPAPLPFDAKNFPLRDSHQGVTIAVDPYLTVARAKSIFDGHVPNEVGVLPVEVILTNDTDSPLRIEIERCQIILSRGKKLDPLPIQKIVARLYRLELDTRVGIPVPGPPRPGTGKKSGSRKNAEAAEADFRSRRFELRRIAPHSSARGFLFFDLGKPLEIPAGAVLYVPEVIEERTGQPLFYFEVPLAAAPGRTPSSE